MEYVVQEEAKKVIERELKKSRQLRHAQVRQQSIVWSEETRRRFQIEKERQTKLLTDALTAQAQANALEKIEQLTMMRDLAIAEVGAAHRAAAALPDFQHIKELKRLKNEEVAKQRGLSALKNQRVATIKQSENVTAAQALREKVRILENMKAKDLVERRPFSQSNSAMMVDRVTNKHNKLPGPPYYQQSIAKTLRVPIASQEKENLLPVSPSKKRGVKSISGLQPWQAHRTSKGKSEQTQLQPPAGRFAKEAEIRTSKTKFTVSPKKPTSPLKKSRIPSTDSEVPRVIHSPVKKHKELHSKQKATHPQIQPVKYYDSAVPQSDVRYIPPPGLVHRVESTGSPTAWQAGKQLQEKTDKVVETRVKNDKKREEIARKRGLKALRIEKLNRELQAATAELQMVDQSMEIPKFGSQSAHLGLEDSEETSKSESTNVKPIVKKKSDSVEDALDMESEVSTSNLPPVPKLPDDVLDELFSSYSSYSKNKFKDSISATDSGFMRWANEEYRLIEEELAMLNQKLEESERRSRKPSESSSRDKTTTSTADVLTTDRYAKSSGRLSAISESPDFGHDQSSVKHDKTKPGDHRHKSSRSTDNFKLSSHERHIRLKEKHRKSANTSLKSNSTESTTDYYSPPSSVMTQSITPPPDTLKITNETTPSKREEKKAKKGIHDTNHKLPTTETSSVTRPTTTTATIESTDGHVKSSLALNVMFEVSDFGTDESSVQHPDNIQLPDHRRKSGSTADTESSPQVETVTVKHHKRRKSVKTHGKVEFVSNSTASAAESYSQSPQEPGPYTSTPDATKVKQITPTINEIKSKKALHRYVNKLLTMKPDSVEKLPVSSSSSSSSSHIIADSYATEISSVTSTVASPSSSDETVDIRRYSQTLHKESSTLIHLTLPSVAEESEDEKASRVAEYSSSGSTVAQVDFRVSPTHKSVDNFTAHTVSSDQSLTSKLAALSDNQVIILKDNYDSKTSTTTTTTLHSASSNAPINTSSSQYTTEVEEGGIRRGGSQTLNSSSFNSETRRSRGLSTSSASGANGTEQSTNSGEFLPYVSPLIAQIRAKANTSSSSLPRRDVGLNPRGRSSPGDFSSEPETKEGEIETHRSNKVMGFYGDTSEGDICWKSPNYFMENNIEIASSVYEELKNQYASISILERPPWLSQP